MRIEKSRKIYPPPCSYHLSMQRDTEEFIELLTGAQSAVFGYIVSLCHDHALAKDILQETNAHSIGRYQLTKVNDRHKTLPLIALPAACTEVAAASQVVDQGYFATGGVLVGIG